jgi:hypothetical protein
VRNSTPALIIEINHAGCQVWIRKFQGAVGLINTECKDWPITPPRFQYEVNAIKLGQPPARHQQVTACHANDVQVAEVLNEQIGVEMGRRRPNPIEKSTVGRERESGGSSSFVSRPGDQ